MGFLRLLVSVCPRLCLVIAAGFRLWFAGAARSPTCGRLLVVCFCVVFFARLAVRGELSTVIFGVCALGAEAGRRRRKQEAFPRSRKEGLKGGAQAQNLRAAKQEFES